MKKYIEVIIKHSQHHKKAIKKVTKGYAFNYLIPHQLAELATKGRIKQLQLLQDLSSQKQKQIDQLSSQIHSQIMKVQAIHIRRKCGTNYQIFGSISEQDIQKKLAQIIGKTIDKKLIIINPIKQVGTYKGYVSITQEIKTPINITILPHHI